MDEDIRDNMQYISTLDPQSLVRFMKIAEKVSLNDFTHVMDRINPLHILDLMRVIKKRGFSVLPETTLPPKWNIFVWQKAVLRSQIGLNLISFF